MHADGWGCERVVWWEEECTPVLAVVVRGIGRAGDDVMPF